LGSSPPIDLRAKHEVPTRTRSTAGRVFEATHAGALMIVLWPPHKSVPRIDAFRRLLARRGSSRWCNNFGSYLANKRCDGRIGSGTAFAE